MKYPVYLNALRAFEASARHQSFSAAATELNVTPAAVGQQVRGLEEWLGTPLFYRSGTGTSRLMPTDTAQRALPDIRAGFDKLSIGLERLKQASTGGALTVTVSPAFAAKWLMPRIDRFHQAYPQTDLRLDTNLKALDFLASGIDVGVRYGSGDWPGLAAIKLADEEIYPVCSPSYLKRHGPFVDPAALAGHTLIHDLSMQNHPGFQTWRSWLDAAGFPSVQSERGLQINNSAAVLQAAIDNQGIALGRSVMMREDLTVGRLVRLFETISSPSKLAYYIVYRPECAELPRVAAFREWLMSEVN
ncbi:transcriptional regulator, LysR family [Janthinobacterium sp. Marseille]|uniref:Transcriptional regulator GcvA n=1 Tax=Herminiimonas aquatilis TaxID=345342 RepID=A0ABW2J681_9BURK|nr:transcriptional regulator GcvA [Janthinobacterium sp. Marseille]ABR91530.1 transcriptional regulator, LysR family [Janthinobacterium sp. Marseille]